MRIIVVGGGMQGRVIAENLLARDEKPEVVIVDVREPAVLPAGARYHQANVLEPEQAKAFAKGADATVLAVPSEIAHMALANLIAAGVPVSDVSFTPNPPLDLDEAAKKTGACCIVDVGVAPGLCHILAASAYSELGGLDSIRILVGGMPQDPPPVFKHAIYFNAHDLLSEYVRPARARRAGKDIQPAPLDVEFEQFDDGELGHLEGFLSDGLRSLLPSFPDVKEMTEWTLRWPGHLEAMKDLREIGLLESPEGFRAIGNTIATRYSSDAFPDVLLMVVEAKRGKELRAWRLLDKRTNNQSAMSRTTGYTTAAVAMVLARKQFTEPGVHPPEHLGRDPKLTNVILEDLARRGVKVTSLVPA